MDDRIITYGGQAVIEGMMRGNGDGNSHARAGWKYRHSLKIFPQSIEVEFQEHLSWYHFARDASVFVLDHSANTRRERMLEGPALYHAALSRFRIDCFSLPRSCGRRF
jgi:hypothetical protein